MTVRRRTTVRRWITVRQRMTVRRWTAKAGLVAVVSLTLVACGSDDPGSAVAEASAVQVPSTTSPTSSPSTSTPSPSSSTAGIPTSTDGTTAATSPPRPTKTASASPSSPASRPAAASEFVRVVRAKVPEVAAGRTDKEIRGIAQRACRGLARGDSADDLIAQTRTLGTLDAEATDFATASELIKLAIDTDCPDQAGRVDDF